MPGQQFKTITPEGATGNHKYNIAATNSVLFNKKISICITSLSFLLKEGGTYSCYTCFHHVCIRKYFGVKVSEDRDEIGLKNELST